MENSNKIKIYRDKRATGQGKSHDMINYILNNNVRCLIICPNVSNIEDLKGDTLKHFLDLPKEHFRLTQFKKMVEEALTELKEEIKTGNVSAKRQAYIDKRIWAYTKYLTEENYWSEFLTDLAELFLQDSIPIVNSFFGVAKILTTKVRSGLVIGGIREYDSIGNLIKVTGGIKIRNIQEKKKLPPSIKAFYRKVEEDYTEEDYTEDWEEYNKYSKVPISYDTIFIEEADKTLGSISLKPKNEVASWIEVVNPSTLYKDYIDDLALTGGSEYEKVGYPFTKIKNPTEDENKNQELEKIPHNILNINTSWKIKTFLEKRGLKIHEYTNEKVEYENEFLEKAEANWYKKYGYNSTEIFENEEEFRFTCIIDFAEWLHGFIRPNGKVLCLGATSNNILQTFTQHDNFEITEDFYNGGIPFHKAITYNLIKVDPKNQELIKQIEYNKELFVVVSSKKMAYCDDHKEMAKRYYFTQGNLRGSNSFSSKEGVFFNFGYFEVKEAPCRARLGYWGRIGNNFYTCLADIEKYKASYGASNEPFARYKTNTIVQIIGRLNRGVNEKNIYYTDDIIGEICENYIKKYLKQKVLKK